MLGRAARDEAGFGGFTSPKSLDRVLEFLFYLGAHESGWVFLTVLCPKHLPADVLELTPLRGKVKPTS